MSENKTKLLYLSDSGLSKTGFGRASRAILSFLYSTGKYEIVQYCCGYSWSHPDLKALPWKAYGTLPDFQEELNEVNKDPNKARLANYGDYNLNKIIEQEKPDHFLMAQDIWGIDFACNRPWFNKINTILWTTLDSRPILPSALEAAKKSKHFWVWSGFAERDMHKLGQKHVKTVHGPIEHSKFLKLSTPQKDKLRLINNIKGDDFIIGFVFRNQLRKSVPNLIEGFTHWKKKYKINNAKLLLHTHWAENPAKSWDIPRLMKEYGLETKDVLTTYVCKKCNNYEVRPYTGQDIDCRYCKSKKCQTTTNTKTGVTEEQLNEVYNLMDVYCHPITSGGQEMPIQEAKFCELITLVTNYSCGEDMCEEEAHSLPLEWFKNTEVSTNFEKASTDPKSIAKQLNKVYGMTAEKRKEWGGKAREWVKKHYALENVGKEIDEYLGKLPTVDREDLSIFDSKLSKKNPDAKIDNKVYDREFIIELYKKILLADADDNDPGFKHWMSQFTKGVTREKVEQYFRDTARKDNESIKPKTLEDELDSEGKDGRILYVMPKSIGDVFLSTALFKSLKEQYPDCNLYVATEKQNKSVLSGNPYIHKVLEYKKEMDSQLHLEGQGDHKGFFKCAFLPYLATQRIYTKHHKNDNIAFELNYEN
tara:strand:- start:70 stop:2010 length:1941 start_codon:yes stop_codon:yes gene_type:complete